MKNYLVSVVLGLFIGFFLGYEIYKEYFDRSDDLYRMVYKVYYDKDNVRCDTITNTGPIYVGSDRGTNFIKRNSLTGPTVIKTSAPIEVISYTKMAEKKTQKTSEKKVTAVQPFITTVIDSCEYIRNETYGIDCYVYTHKGNCRFCKERRDKELLILIKEK